MSGRSRPQGPASESATTLTATIVRPATDRTAASAPKATALARLIQAEAIERANGNGSAWWCSCADQALAYLASTGLPFSADDLWDLGVPAPDHPCRVGGAVHAAAKAGLIRQTGFALSRRASRHAGVQRIWVGVR